VSTADQTAGVAEAEAISHGVQRVFTVAGCLSIALIVIVLFVRRPQAPVEFADDTSGGALDADAVLPERV
ncbi:MFS transporter, partial [Streptomyces sp. SID10244]|nr:MFS transporter [Streptomyces sp. SID10244]